MRRIFFNIFMTICILLSIFMYSVKTLAEEETDTSPFSIGTIFSEHQTDKSDSFYDILWTPTHTDTFGIRITNNTNNDQTYTIKTGKAKTTSTGSINYTNTNEETEAEKYKISDMLKIPNEFKVPANSSRVVNGTITFPSDAEYNGILIGGINVSEKIDDKDSTSGTITNKVSYTTPLVIRGNVDKRPNPEIKFKGVSVKQLTANNYSLNTKIYNVKTNLLNDSTFSATIKDAKGKIIDTQKNSLDITPETIFEYPIKLSGDYPSGKYTVDLKINHENRQWTYSNNFIIGSEQASAIKKVKPNKDRNLKIILFIVFIFFILMLFIFFVFRKKFKPRG